MSVRGGGGGGSVDGAFRVLLSLSIDDVGRGPAVRVKVGELSLDVGEVSGSVPPGEVVASPSGVGEVEVGPDGLVVGPGDGVGLGDASPWEDEVDSVGGEGVTEGDGRPTPDVPVLVSEAVGGVTDGSAEGRVAGEDGAGEGDGEADEGEGDEVAGGAGAKSHRG